MNLNEDNIKNEVRNFLSSIQRMLPTRKQAEILEKLKPKVTRLSDIHVESKNVFPNCFVGVRAIIHGDIVDRVKLVQHFNIGQSKNTYNCYKRYLHNELEPQKTENAMVLNSSGSYVCSTALYRETFEGGLELRVSTKIKNLVASQIKVDFEKVTPKSVASIGCNMRDMKPTLVTQWIYKVAADLSVGSELRLGDQTNLSLSARYQRDSCILSWTLSQYGFQMCLFKKFAQNLSISCIVTEKNHKGGPAHFGIAVHKTFGDTDLKVFVDSEACGGFTSERKVQLLNNHQEELVLRILGSCLINRQRHVQFGFGFNFEYP